MKTISIALLSLTLCLFSANSEALNSAVSANGFTCKTGPKQAVECQGKFPNVPNVLFKASGYTGVTLSAENFGEQYLYFSSNGCLCKSRKSGASSLTECRSRTGRVRPFALPRQTRDLMGWCNTN